MRTVDSSVTHWEKMMLVHLLVEKWLEKPMAVELMETMLVPQRVAACIRNK
jgi:hypothetical protein